MKSGLSGRVPPLQALRKSPQSVSFLLADASRDAARPTRRCEVDCSLNVPDRPTHPSAFAEFRPGLDRPTDPPPRAARRKFGSDRSTDRPGRAQRGEKSTVGTDRPTDPAARSAAQNLRSGPTDRPTQNSLIRWVGRHRPTDPPGTPPGDVQRTIYFAPPYAICQLSGCRRARSTRQLSPYRFLFDMPVNLDLANEKVGAKRRHPPATPAAPDKMSPI